ncbi:hypothetical protein HMPREF9702_00329 [Delftia acidovorans CCUG 15835]|nr:hypothetical protein HMPREF9702_00329 [Delftia acidovorans CCUG 15835]
MKIRTTTPRRKFINIGGGHVDGMPFRFCRETAELSHGDRATEKNTVVVEDEDDIEALEDAYQVNNLAVPWHMFCRLDREQNPR